MQNEKEINVVKKNAYFVSNKNTKSHRGYVRRRHIVAKLVLAHNNNDENDSIDSSNNLLVV